MADSFSFRKPNFGDCSSVLSLLAQLSPYSPAAATQRESWQSFLDDSSNYSLVAFNESSLIAFGYFHCISTPRGGIYATIQEIVVSKNYRAQRVGFHLVRHLVNAAFCTRSCFKVELACQTHTQPFYEKCGFIQDGLNLVQRPS